MSSGNTETRILQMQLENKDFEAGVRQTIQSLESLEEKLNLKNAGDGFEKISAAANSVQMGHLESGIDAVTDKFTLLGQIGLQAMEQVAHAVVSTGEKILRAATVQPMIDGWGEFEMKTNSVQTILGGIRHQFDSQPAAINAISDSLDELNKYADKTIYNFAQMTENVGKFTNQEIGLEESTNAIKGIANWAAAVGANPAQMSRAMYNISQSLGAGSMQLIDWRSIRFANMATPEVKKLFAEVAKRVNPSAFDKNGNVRVGKKTLDVIDDFESSLKSGWLTNDVMAEAFSIYAKAFSKEELIAKYGEELGTQFYEMGEYAEEAATKVRTFSQLMGVLKESLGSGWANTFDILFGGFEQQTEFLTAIKDRIEEIINFQTEDRNTWLQDFSNIGGIQVLQDVVLKTIDIFKDFYWVVNDVVSMLLNPFGDSVLNMDDGIFSPRKMGYSEFANTWENVKGIFDDISATLDKFRTWLYTKNEKTGRSPIHNLASALSGVAGAAGIAWKVLTGFGKLVFRLFKRFEPLVSSVLDLLGQIGGTIYNLFFNLAGEQSIEKIFDKIGDAIEPVVDFVVGLATAVVDLIHNLLGIDAAADDWTVLGERMKAFWDIFTYDPNLDFATNIKNSVKKALVAIFGEDTAESMLQAWDTNVKPVLTDIEGFFTRAFGDLERVLNGFRSAAEADYSQANGVTGGLGTFLNAFLKGYFGEDTEGAEEAYSNILGIYHQIQTYYDENVKQYVDSLGEIFTKTLPELNGKIFDFLFGKETSVITGPGQSFSYRKGGLIQSIQEFFKPENLDKTIKSIQAFFDPIIAGITDAWNKFYDFLFGKETSVITGPGKSFSYRKGGLIQDIQEFFKQENLDETIKSIQAFFDPIIAGIEDALTRVNDFLFGHEITGKQGNKWREGGLIQGIQEFFKQENLNSIIKSIREFFDPIIAGITDAWNNFYDFLFGHEITGKQGNKWREGGLINGINDFFGSDTWKEDWNLIKGAFEEVSSWITDKGNAAWNTIMTFLFGPEITGKQGNTWRAGGAYDAALEFLNPVFDWLKEKGEYLYTYLTTHNFQEMWKDLGDLLFGYDYVVMTGPGQDKKVHKDGVLSPIVNVLQPIADAFNMVKDWAIEKFASIDWAGIWESINRFFNGYDGIYVDKKGYSTTKHFDGVFEKISSFFDSIIDYFNSPEFQEFWTSVKTFYHEHIEPTLNWIGGLGGTIFSAFGDLLSGKGFSGFGNVGTYISEGVNKLMSEMFGEGTDLQSILDTFFGGGKPGEQPSGTEAKDGSGGGFFGWIGQILSGEASLFSSTANAAEADGSEIADASNSIVATLGDTEKKSSSILDAVSGLLPYFGGAAAIGLVGKVGDMITGITGNRKPTILEQIAGLIRSLGEPLKGLGLAIAAAGFSEFISPGAMDNLFGHITAILDKLFGWLEKLGLWGIFGGGLFNFVGNLALNKTTGAKGGFSSDNLSSIIESVGQGLSGIMDSLQTLFWLTIEVMGADWLMGAEKKADGTVAYNFDKRMDRVLGFVEKVMTTITTSTWLPTLFTLANTLAGGVAANIAGINGNITYQPADTISSTFIGIGSLAEAICNGVAALMTASIIPGAMNFDIGKLTEIINAVFTGINWLATIGEGGTITSIVAAIKNVGFWQQLKTWAASASGLGLILTVVGGIAGQLIDWYAELMEKHMTNMAGDIYVFVTSLESAINALASFEDGNAGKAESFLTTDMPEIFKAISSDEIGYDKNKMEERGKAIRDFGNRIRVGIRSIATAKDTFDKYNEGGSESFPLAFFKAMTEALTYYNSEGIKDLYDEFFATGFGGSAETLEQEKGIQGIIGFFNAIGSLGYVVNEYQENNPYTGQYSSGVKLESTKEFLGDFQDSFASIQGTFSELIDDIGKEGFSVEKINALSAFISKIAEAGKIFADTYLEEYLGGIGETVYKQHGDTSPISGFGLWIASIGKGIKDFDNAIKENGQYVVDYNQLESALKAIEPMMEIEQILRGYESTFSEESEKIVEFKMPMPGFLNSTPEDYDKASGSASSLNKWESNTKHWIEDVIPLMEKLGGGLHQLAWQIQPEDVGYLQTASGALHSLAEFFGQSMYVDLKSMTVGDIGGYTNAFNELKKSVLVTQEEKSNSLASIIQDVMNASGESGVQLKIVPILDDTTPGGKLLSDIAMTDNYTRTISLQMDPSIIVKDSQETLAELRTANATLTALIEKIHSENVSNMESISGLGGHIDGVAREVGNMNVYLDTGKLIGTIDEALGWRMLMTGRTGTPGYP